MLELIYDIQAYIASQGLSIDSILAMICGLIAFIITVYFVAFENSNKENNQ